MIFLLSTISERLVTSQFRTLEKTNFHISPTWLINVCSSNVAKGQLQYPVYGTLDKSPFLLNSRDNCMNAFAFSSIQKSHMTRGKSSIRSSCYSFWYYIICINFQGFPTLAMYRSYSVSKKMTRVRSPND